MNSKKAKSKRNPSLDIKTLQEIYEFEDRFMEATASEEDKAWLHEGPPAFNTAAERDQYLLDHASDFQTDENLVDQVLYPFRRGEKDEALIALEPVIFKAMGKTAPSVPCIKVFATTSFSGSSEVNHLLHTKARSK
jgi:hypothetical protein